MSKKLTLADLLVGVAEGDVIWTTTKDTSVAAFAQRAGVTAKTERWLAIHPASRTVEEVTRITITGGRVEAEEAPVKPARSRAPVEQVVEPIRSRKPVKSSVNR